MPHSRTLFHACKILNLTLEKTNLSVTGINSIDTNLNCKTRLTIESRINNYKLNIKCFVIPDIANDLPNTAVNRDNFNIPNNIKLADPQFHQTGPIDLLIGASHFWHLLSVGQIKLKNNCILHNTVFGWIVSGGCQLPTNQITSCLSMNTLHNLVHEFWKVDEFKTNSKLLTPDEQRCEQMFRESTTRCADGKFLVKLPLLPNLDQLGDSFEVAKTRFLAQEKKFLKDPKFKEQYANCIHDYVSQGHTIKITDAAEQSFYLPHHAVIKESSETTKLRVVFDGSCKLDNGLPINQIQYVGPTIQDDLFSIITRFRTHAYVFTADIKQMYRQIWVHPEHTKFQNILWRDSPDEPIHTLQTY